MWHSVKRVPHFLLDPDTQQEYSFREEREASMSGIGRAQQTHEALQAARNTSSNRMVLNCICSK